MIHDGFIEWDHPRVCGEQYPSFLLAARLQGSPPRVRGTEYNMYNMFCQYRITPACAGNRARLPPIFLRRKDHPRVCGEQGWVIAACSASRGSPPRVRGTVITTSWRMSECRITPACAGNSGQRTGKMPRCRDHPRVCGEQLQLAC